MNTEVLLIIAAIFVITAVPLMIVFFRISRKKADVYDKEWNEQAPKMAKKIEVLYNSEVAKREKKEVKSESAEVTCKENESIDSNVNKDITQELRERKNEENAVREDNVAIETIKDEKKAHDKTESKKKNEAGKKQKKEGKGAKTLSTKEPKKENKIDSGIKRKKGSQSIKINRVEHIKRLEEELALIKCSCNKTEKKPINNTDSIGLFSKLNEKQAESVRETEGRVRIVAGAGSGKTRVLAHRYAYLIKEIGIDPGNILCMTFTNKAAQEMKNRISSMVDRACVTDLVCTIHGFCVKFLRKEIYRIGYPKTFIICDDDDAKVFAKEVMDKFQITRDKKTVRTFLSDINIAKGQMQTGYVSRYILCKSMEAVEKGENDQVAAYINLQKKYNTLDFQVLIYFTLYILDNFEDAREYWQNKLNYIMVDEVQDCNVADWILIETLAKKHNNLFVVGDPDQAIYEWRGARPEAFVEFKADKDIILNENYRSTPNILDVANSIIINNKMRVEKDLFTQNQKGKAVLHYHAKNEKQEAEWIASRISEQVEVGVDLGDIAILYRASYLSRAIEEALIKKKIKYVIWGGIRFFERKEIKDCLAYLRLAVSNDDIAFQRIINVPSRRFGSVSLEKVKDLAEKSNCSLFEALVQNSNEKTFDKPAIHEFINLIQEMRLLGKSRQISTLMDKILKKSGLEDMYRNDEEEEKLENISELIYSMKNYEEDNANEDFTVESYLQDIALYTNVDMKESGSFVRLMTIHQAKGLEFPIVYIIGLSEGIFPSHRSIRDRKMFGLEEERRLMYVALTRAEKFAFLTESEGFDFVGSTEKYPSRFIMEIKKELIEVEGDVDEKLFEQTQRLAMELDYPTFKVNIGDAIVHPTFGEGKVIALHNDGTSLEVQFGSMTRFLNAGLFYCSDAAEDVKTFTLKQSSYTN